MSEPGPTGLIPQSDALAEASAYSLTEVMSMNPEEYPPGELPRIVAVYRAQRERFALSDQAKPQKASGATRKTTEAILSTTPQSAEDLGF